MSLIDLLRDRFREGVWKGTCEAGAPVPEADGCHQTDCTSVRLTTLPRDGRGAVSCLEEPWTAESAKLAALGILPGVRLRVVQRSPGWVVKIGRTRLALDAELARRVRVVRDEDSVLRDGPALPILGARGAAPPR